MSKMADSGLERQQKESEVWVKIKNSLTGEEFYCERPFKDRASANFFCNTIEMMSHHSRGTIVEDKDAASN